MPKRPKAKVHVTPKSIEKTTSPTKAARIAKQAEATARNNSLAPKDTPHGIAVARRRRMRIAQGKPQMWLKEQKSKYKDSGPNAVG
jgi:hypothetical protein